nr:conjugal transfer protein TraG N-terminal domain-containing protein [Alphaproteobacteria bacterium]
MFGPYDIVTIGNAGMLRDVFDAVAAIMGGDDYATSMVVVGLVGVLWGGVMSAVSNSLMTTTKWVLAMTVITMALFTPKASVRIVDRLDFAPGGGSSIIVDNVPFGLAYFAHLTTSLGDRFTGLFETTFSPPAVASYQQNGMLYGAGLMAQATKFEVQDNAVTESLSSYMQNCVFYSVLQGRMRMDDVMRAEDMWQVVSTQANAPSLSFVLTTEGTGGASVIEREIVTCETGAITLNDMLTDDIEAGSTGWAGRLKSWWDGTSGGGTDPTTSAFLATQIGSSHDFLFGSSGANGTEVLRQQAMINAFINSGKDFAGQTGNDAVMQEFVRVRTEKRAQEAYKFQGLQAQKWVPLLHSVFELLYIAMFPIAFLLMLSPMYATVLKGYFSGLVWLSSWGPCFVILNTIMMRNASVEMQGICPTGVTVVCQLGVVSVESQVSQMAGYLSMSVPFITTGIMFGAGKLQGLATSLLSVPQRAAAQGAEELATGNISHGNLSFDNLSYGNQSHSSLSAYSYNDSISTDMGRMSGHTAGGSGYNASSSGEV